MSATITIEDLLGPEGWDDAVHPARLAAETEFLIAESMQTLLLNMRARLLRAGDPAAEDGAMAAAVRQLADAQRGLNYLSLIQSRLVRTYRADAAFDDARDEVRLAHRDRLRTFAGAAIAANMPEAKRRSDARKEVEARLARITAAFQAAAGNEAAAEAQDHETPPDAALQAPQDDCAQIALRMPATGENDEIALRTDPPHLDGLEASSRGAGQEHGPVVSWRSPPPERQRGGQPGNRNRLKTGRFTAEARASRLRSRLLRRALRDLGVLVKEVVALRNQGVSAVSPQEFASPGPAPP